MFADAVFDAARDAPSPAVETEGETDDVTALDISDVPFGWPDELELFNCSKPSGVLLLNLEYEIDLGLEEPRLEGLPRPKFRLKPTAEGRPLAERL